ncbi:MAG: threonylcarbamoyl-AMP synthase [Salinivirgaceae bacterium]|nr:threonylcarbamoyl-AMP synthase [Salinivirgaceae bacterium]MBO7594813.1 threonylcarbamoyl-AMP synthase [Salinivirgaceae bacterium]
MLIKIYPENPNPREIKKIAQIIDDGGLVIYPTDTIYGIGCDITKPKAVARLAQIQGLDMDKAFFSFIFNDLSQLSEYTKPMSNPAFKLLKRNVPGPFTFIFEANNNIPKLFKTRRKTIGIRLPDNNIVRAIVSELGRPLLSSSVHDDQDEVTEYITDPELIHERYGNVVDAVIDGGYGDNQPSTVVDCTTDEFEVIRQGKGELC